MSYDNFSCHHSSLMEEVRESIAGCISLFHVIQLAQIRIYLAVRIFGGDITRTRSPRRSLAELPALDCNS